MSQALGVGVCSLLALAHLRPYISAGFLASLELCAHLTHPTASSLGIDTAPPTGALYAPHKAALVTAKRDSKAITHTLH